MKIITLSIAILMAFPMADLRAQTYRQGWERGIPFSGNYIAYKWVGEEITELTEEEANSFLKMEMRISQGIFFLFDDTVRSPIYRQSKMDQHSFFLRYTVNEKHFKALKDTLTVLKVLKDDSTEERSIIVTGTDLIVNYKGCFYYFKRKRDLPKKRP